MEHAHDERCSHPSREVILYQVKQDIRAAGWHCVGVLPGEEPGEPAYAYTIGLFQSWDHPELVIVGLPPERAYDVLGEIVSKIREGSRFSDGERSGNILHGVYDVRFLDVEPASCILGFGIAEDWYHGAQIPRLQVLWPDTSNRLPGELLCDMPIRDIQDIYKQEENP